MISCPNECCNKKIEEIWKYCTNCGLNLEEFFKSENKLYDHARKLETTSNYSDAEYCYKRCSQLGNANAMYSLGLLYEHGKGVVKNIKSAEYCFGKAANLQHIKAIYWIANMYYTGNELKAKDLKVALDWYEKAYNLGEKSVANLINELKDTICGGSDLAIYLQPNKDRETEKSKDEEHFRNCLEKFENSNDHCEADLAMCYLNGIGTTKDIQKALTFLVDGAYKKSNNSLRLLGDCYYCGNIVNKNINLANYIYSLAKGEEPQAINQYKPIDFRISEKENNEKGDILAKERNKLNSVINSIDNRIQGLEDRIETNSSYACWGSDKDERQYRAESNFSNKQKCIQIDNYKKLRFRPYYARMDTIHNGSKEVHYIGEESYFDGPISIVSVWSEYGQRYRAKNIHNFNINGHEYQIELRRRIEIVNDKLIDIFDEYSTESTASMAQITDPFLLKVLEEKKGETNITNIIRTIQINQNDIIDYDFNKSLIVQGCAGSGKTMILLHRLANMKFNVKGLDFIKIKVITPNKQFNLFIDELSKNLKIETIDKLPLTEYYACLMEKYRYDNQECYKKKIITKNKNGDPIEIYDDAWRETGSDIYEEKKLIRDDVLLDNALVECIYSDTFAENIKNYVANLKVQFGTQLHYGAVMKLFNEAFTQSISSINNNKFKPNYNYNCILYSKVLLLYEYFGCLVKKDSLLCIDEGQDISKTQYILMHKVNGENVLFNIYGDFNQQIPRCVGIGRWEQLTKDINAKYFTLNENYRNSEEIIEFYNKKLSFNDFSLGVKTKHVEFIALKTLETNIKLQMLLKNRIAIICNDTGFISEEIKKYCVIGTISNKKASLLTVKQAKGLEFDVVYVLIQDMSKNEKYIAFTRALSELYVLEFDYNIDDSHKEISKSIDDNFLRFQELEKSRKEIVFKNEQQENDLTKINSTSKVNNKYNFCPYCNSLIIDGSCSNYSCRNART